LGVWGVLVRVVVVARSLGDRQHQAVSIRARRSAPRELAGCRACPCRADHACVNVLSRHAASASVAGITGTAGCGLSIGGVTTRGVGRGEARSMRPPDGIFLGCAMPRRRPVWCRWGSTTTQECFEMCLRAGGGLFVLYATTVLVWMCAYKASVATSGAPAGRVATPRPRVCFGVGGMREPAILTARGCPSDVRRRSCTSPAPAKDDGRGLPACSLCLG